MTKSERTTVKIFRVKNGISEILKQAVSESGLKGKKKIFVKPNMSHPEYIPGVVTCPELLSELVGLLRDGGSEVIVGESNGFNYPCNSAFEKTGIRDAVVKAGGRVINLSEDKVVKVNFSENNSPLKQLFLAENCAGR